MSLWIDSDGDGDGDIYTETVDYRVPETGGEPAADETTPDDPGAPAVQATGAGLSLFQIGGSSDGEGAMPDIPWTAILLGLGGVALLLTMGGD